MMRITGKTKNVYLLLLVIIIGAFIVTSCEKEAKEPPKSMEQMQKEEGISVEVQTVGKKEFNKTLNLFAKLSGIQEATQNAMLADKIVRVNAKIGSRVGAGSIVMQFPSDNPALQYSQAKTALENSEKTYKRLQELVKAGETAQQNFDNIEAQYQVSKRNFEAIKQMINVESPISGTVIELFHKAGEVAEMGKPLFTVAQTHIMKATAWVSEDEINLIKLGMPATIIFGGKEYTGKISEVGLAMDDFKRAFKIEAQFKNPKNELKSGVSTDLHIVTYTNKETIVIARNLIMNEGDKQYVYVENGGKAHKRYIQTGEQSGIDVEVLSGVNPGDKLITKGQALVQDGTKIKLSK